MVIIMLLDLATINTIIPPLEDGLIGGGKLWAVKTPLNAVLFDYV